MNAKELYQDIKNFFKEKFEEPAQPPVEAPKVYKLEDGTEVTIDKLEVGGVVKIGESPAPAGTHKLEDGSSIVVDEAGVITELIPVVAAAASPEATPNPEDALNKFATGTAEERLANIEVVCKALMEYNLGWKIEEAKRKASEEAAIKVYQDSLATVTAQVADQKELMGKMLQFMEQILDVPNEQPTEQKKKYSFSKADSKEDRLKQLSENMKKIRQSN